VFKNWFPFFEKHSLQSEYWSRMCSSEYSGSDSKARWQHWQTAGETDPRCLSRFRQNYSKENRRVSAISVSIGVRTNSWWEISWLESSSGVTSWQFAFPGIVVEAVSNDLDQRKVPSSDLSVIGDDDTDRDETILQALRNNARETKAAENRELVERIVATKTQEREAAITSITQPPSGSIVQPTRPAMPWLNFTHRQLKDMPKYWNNFSFLMRKSWSLQANFIGTCPSRTAT